MRTLIQEKLRELETREQIKILWAAESGSRAWGFASPDSDYDVRFIYIRPRDAYLRLDPTRDVIELPINEDLDINGWDLTKALRLLYKSNPTLFEWFSSPIVYAQDAAFVTDIQPLLRSYFSVSTSIAHYLHMSQNNNREFLQRDHVKLKKYFYVLRPLMACRWVLDRGTPPPMAFAELMAAQLPHELQPTVEQLLDWKMHDPELKKIPRVEPIHQYIADSFATITLPTPGDAPDWEPLNRFFLQELSRYR